MSRRFHKVIEHTHLHQILRNQIFLKWWWCMVEDIVMKNEIWWPRSIGGLDRPGPTYICGSVSLYETVAQALLKALYKHRTVTKTGAESLLATAFAECRLMLDIFMTPRTLLLSEPMISVSKLAHNTGHRENSQM